MPNAAEPRAPWPTSASWSPQWLEGTIASIPTAMPGYGPDEETADLIPVLAACITWTRP
jgi:hypothetical protein